MHHIECPDHIEGTRIHSVSHDEVPGEISGEVSDEISLMHDGETSLNVDDGSASSHNGLAIMNKLNITNNKGTSEQNTTEQNTTAAIIKVYSEEMINSSSKYKVLVDERECMIDLIKSLNRSIEKTGETWMTKHQNLQSALNKVIEENVESKKLSTEMERKLKDAEDGFKDVLDLLMKENEQLRTENVKIKNDLKVKNEGEKTVLLSKDQFTQCNRSEMANPSISKTAPPSNYVSDSNCAYSTNMQNINTELIRLSGELTQLTKLLKSNK